ncbi:hypothetical protein ABZV29_18355 [Streptomyces sp. NPDC005236]|uniref:hypothetical protein n=1 Tax=Streptomyces sp. NPDC005236 TaxID=3157028 RepID=UPI0033A962BF
MDRFALCRTLQAAGVPPASYEIADCPGGHRAADRYFLDGHEGDWTVGVHERGTREVFERFADEGEACRWLRDRLLGGEPPARDPADAPGEPAGPGSDPEALQRRADDELEAALAAMSRRTVGESGREHPGESGGEHREGPGGEHPEEPAEGDGPA